MFCYYILLVLLMMRSHIQKKHDYVAQLQGSVIHDISMGETFFTDSYGSSSAILRFEALFSQHLQVLRYFRVRIYAYTLYIYIYLSLSLSLSFSLSAGHLHLHICKYIFTWAVSMVIQRKYLCRKVTILGDRPNQTCTFSLQSCHTQKKTWKNSNAAMVKTRTPATHLDLPHPWEWRLLIYAYICIHIYMYMISDAYIWKKVNWILLVYTHIYI